MRTLIMFDVGNYELNYFVYVDEKKEGNSEFFYMVAVIVSERILSNLIDNLRNEQNMRKITELHFADVEYSRYENSKYDLTKRWLEILKQFMSDFPEDLFVKFLGINSKELDSRRFGASTDGEVFYREYSRFLEY